MIVQKNRVGNPICLIAFVLALSAAPLAGQVPLDRQGNPSLEGVTGNDTPATATLFAPGGTFPPTAYRAAFDSATDVDFYKVRLQFGETLAIRVTAFSSPGPLFGATFFDVTGTRVLPAFHGLNASSKKVSAISFTAPAAGDYLFECTSGLTMTRYDLTIGIYQNTNANLPDFSNGTLSAQASALPSDVVQVTTSLDGIFDGTAGGSANFSALGAVMLSAHAIPDETAREVGRLGFLDFTTGPSPATKSAVTTVAIPPVPPGNYFLVLKADPDDLVHESSESNNFGAPSAFAVLPRNGTASDPDLTSSAVTGPATASIDKGILASGVVTNGGGSAAGTFQVGFVLSSSGTVSVADPLIGTTSVASLARGASTAVTVRGLVPATLSSGTYRVGMIADVGATVQEANESNNTAIGAASTLVSTPADLADLVVSSYVAQPAGLLGFAATFTASVRNIGGTPAPASKTGFWVGRTLTRQAQDVMVALADTPPLAPGASATVAVTSGYPANLPPNVYAASAEVNQAGNVLESNRSNNILFSAGLTTLVNPADISVTSVSGPSSGSVEDNVLVVAGVKNRSAATSPGFSVQFFLSKDRVFSRADDVFLGDPVGVTPVSGGATRAITTAPVVPSVLTSGSYILGLAVDLPGALTDPDRSNNVAFAATSMTIGRPLDTQADLVALSAAFTRTAAKTGELFGVSASIRNRGHVRSPAFASAFVLSRDRIFLPPSAPVGGDALVASIPVGGLAAGQTTVLTAPARVPLTLAAGTYVLGFIADVLGTVPEFSKTNNTVGSAGTMAITTSGDFDLINRGITCSPTVFSSGQTIRVTSTLEMIGGTQPVDVTLGLDLFTPPAGNDNPFGETVVPGLRPNEVRQVTQQVVVPFVPVPDPNLNGGNYSLVSIIDPRAALSQPRFGDLPPRPASVTVTPPNPTSLPNLIPGAVGGPASTQPGAPVQVTATVTNSSSISVVATFAVVFFIEERDPASSPPMRLRLGDIAVRGLGAGVALPLTATFAVPLLAHPGAYAVVAQADPFRNVFENNEGDNVAAAASVTQLLQATSLTNLAAVSVEA
ncbi:MAG: hypothetical protein HY303_01175, partial [Candidatus Wallbacteria bacterium]|nr:hypothetical protein [Candidatus Wallbacteria bacterium]